MVHRCQQIKDSYNAWGETAKIEATSVINEENPHPEENETKQIATQTESLVQTMQELMRSSKETAASTEKSAAEVKDIARNRRIKTTTADVQSNATTILTNLDQSIQQSKQITKENEEYAKTFEKCCPTRKTAEQTIHKFFIFVTADPRKRHIRTNKTNLISSLLRNINWRDSAYGRRAFITRIYEKRKVTEANLLVQPTRIWLNVPNVFLLSFVAILLA